MTWSKLMPNRSRDSIHFKCGEHDFTMVTKMPAKRVDCDGLKKLIREVPDFPKKGILFYDKVGFARLIDALSENYIGKEIDLVLGMEARGFIFGPALAYRLNAGFV